MLLLTQILVGLLIPYCLGCWAYLAVDLWRYPARVGTTPAANVLAAFITLFAPVAVALALFALAPGFLAYWLGRACGYLRSEFRRGLGDS